MNKKFSTLLAGVLLATTVGASAQTLGAQHYKFRTQDVKSGPASGVKTVKIIESDLLYQLTYDGTKVLVQERDPQTGEVTLAMRAIDSAPLNASLWKIVYDEDGANGKNFSFINKETKLPIVFNSDNADPKSTFGTTTEDATVLDGCINKWAWYNSDEQSVDFNVEPIYSVFQNNEKDSVVVLQANAADEVVAVKYPKSVLNNNAHASLTNPTALTLKPILASGKVLDAKALNTMIDFKDVAKGFKLALNPGCMNGTSPIQDELTNYTFKAIDAADGVIGSAGFIKAPYETDKDGFVVLESLKADGTGTGKYFMVDTAFYNVGDPAATSLKLAVKSFASVKKSDGTASDALSNEAISARYQFKFTYFPSNDSLDIRVTKNGALKLSYDNIKDGTTWADADITKPGTVNGVNYYSWEPNSFKDADKAIVKLAHLTPTHTELTVEPAYVDVEYPNGTIFTRINFKDRIFKYLTRVTLPEGLYHIKEMNKQKFVVANMAGNYQYDVPEDKIQDYDDMPATMWVVKKVGCGDAATVAVYNREYINKVGNDTIPAFVGQLYKDDKGLFFLNQKYDNLSEKELVNTDDYSFVKVEDADALNSEFHGYKNFDPETLKYTKYYMNYNLAEMDDLYLNVTKDGFFARSKGKVTSYELDTVNVLNNNKISFNEFGFGKGVNNLKQLKRNVYTVKVSDENLIDNDTTYIALVKEVGSNEYYKAMGIKDIKAGKGRLAFFYLKADQVKDIANPESEKCYVLVDVNNGTNLLLDNGNIQAHCVDGVERLSHVSLDNEPTARASAFAFTKDDRPLYKTIEAAKNVNIFRTIGTTKQYLFESNGNSINVPNAKEGFGFLGLTQEDINPGEGYTTALYVDEVLSSNPRMPQYMLVVDKDSVENAKWCNEHGYNPGCEHEVYYNGYVAGRFLVNLTDSVKSGTNLETNADQYKYQSMTRLGFVEGVHMFIDNEEAKLMNQEAGEYFFTLIKGTTLADLKDKNDKIIPSKLFDNKLTEKHKIAKGKHNNYSFSLRLKNDTEDGFFLESNKEGTSYIGSFKGAWVKEMNGVLVLAQSGTVNGDHDQTTDNIQEIVNQAQYFQMEETDEVATSNDAIDASSISVTAINGGVIIKGAEGKKVTISNVLGQTIANTVITSSEATISVSAGVVFVAVEGESAVKAIVK